METFLYFVFAYLVGSINGSIVADKLFGLSDPREQGSKNPGATNMLRIYGKKPAVLSLLNENAPDNFLLFWRALTLAKIGSRQRIMRHTWESSSPKKLVSCGFDNTEKALKPCLKAIVATWSFVA